ncbi:hypothetical protein FQZ97_295490 [compost metagenome]
MVGSLLVVQDGNGRQHAGQVAGQEDHRVRLAGTVGLDALLHQVQRVGGTGVLGQAVVAVVGQAGFRVQHDVFQHGAELDGFPDHRLVLLGQVDALGIATAFDVEHGAHAPAVLVVADQVAARVSGQSGLASTGQAEEQGGITFFADVGRAVHRQHVFFRQQEVLHGEHGLLHFTGVAHAGDQHLPGGEVEDHAAVGVGAVTLRLADEVRRVDDLPFLAGLRVVLFRIDEQATAEQVVPGGLGGHLDGQVMLGIGADVHMGDETLALGHISFDTGPQCIELVRREGTVDVAPGDLGVGARLLNDETICRRTTGAMTGFHYQRTVGGQFTLATADGLFDQLRGADIGVHGVIGLRHVVPRRRKAESSKRFVVGTATRYREKSARDYARKARFG